MALEYDLNHVISAAIDNKLSSIHTALPAKVESFESSTRKASVKPLIKRKLVNGQAISLPVIVNVPVMFPSTKDVGITFPVKKGDTGILLFCERSLERWLSEGGEVEPGYVRKFDLSDAIFIPGLFSFKDAEPVEDGILIKSKTGKIKIDSSGKIAIGSQAAELLDLFSQCLTALSTATAAGFPLSNATTYTQLNQLLQQIKGTL